MSTQQILAEALDVAELSATPGRPVYMLNLLRFRETALYQDGRDEPPCSGREAYYERYIPAFRRLIGERAPQRVFAGNALAKLVGPAGARWDIVAVNEYADFATFRAIVDTDAYRNEAQPHRLAALDEFHMFMLDKAWVR